MAGQKELNREAAIAVIRAAAEKRKSTLICRDEIAEFTGGAIKPRHLANLDSQGAGIPGAFKLGRKQVYNILLCRVIIRGWSRFGSSFFIGECNGPDLLPLEGEQAQ